MNKVLFTTTCLAIAMAGRTQNAMGPNNRVITNEEYAHAESMLNYNTEPLIDRAVVQPNWVTGGICWYRVLTATGSEYVLVDAAKKGRSAYADREKLAQAISAATGKPFEVSMLGEGRRGRGGRGGGDQVLSPDGKRAAFIRDWNLWVKDVPTGQETQLTTDGIKDLGYATDNAGWKSGEWPKSVGRADGRIITKLKDATRHVDDIETLSTTR